MKDIYKTNSKDVQNILHVDDLTMTILEDEFQRMSGKGLLAKYTSFFYCMLAILSNILFAILRIRKDSKLTNEDFVFVSCPDSIFRTKTIDLIANGLKYKVIYLPSFHIPAALKYSKFFKSAGIDAVFPTFTIGDVVRAHQNIKKLSFLKNKMATEDWATFRFQMITFLIYEQFVNRIFEQNTSFKGKWVLEHQKFFFIPLISLLRKHNIESIMLQHGCFFKPSFNYLPLYTDKVLTCCEREKNLYIDNGVNPDCITVFGAPLQTMSLGNEDNSKAYDYDVLMMMTLFEVNGELQKMILDYLKEEHPELKVLIRMRPRSRVSDLQDLGKHVEGFTVSEAGISIATDLARVKRCICFSEDATFEVLNAKKSFLLVGTKDSMDKDMYDKCTTSENYKKQIELLLSKDYYSPFSKDELIYMMGEQDVSTLHKMFVNYIHNGV